MKVFKFVLSCLLVLSIVSLKPIYANDSELDNHDSSAKVVSHYTENELLFEIEERIKTALLNGELEVDLLDLNLYYDDYANVWAKLNYITPYLPADISAIVFIFEGGLCPYIELSDTMPKADVLAYFNKIEMEINNILACVDDSMTDVEKALVVHDYFIDQYSYDYERYVNGTMPDESYRPSGLLLYGTGVCEAYGNLYMYIMNRLGIETIYTPGNKIDYYYEHLWDIIKLDGQYYHVDATWDDPVPDRIGRVEHNYFLLSDTAISSARGLSSQTHTDWKRTDLVCSDTKYDNYWWCGVTSQIVIDGNYYYYANDNALLRRHRTTNKVETLMSLGKWNYINGAYFTETYSGVFKKDGFIYYNTEKAIYSYDLQTGKSNQVKIPSLGENKIYGIQYKNNQLNYLVGKSLFDELTIQKLQLVDDSHTHSYTTEVTTNPTCIDKGFTTYTCSCGDNYKDNFVKELGHEFINYLSDNNATTKKDGTKTAKCERCDATNTIVDESTKLPEDSGLLVNGVTRAFGNSRYETAFKVADTLKATLGVDKFNTVIIANGTNFADALAGSYLAAKKDAPILMTDKNAKNITNLVNYIKSNVKPGGTVYILGGYAALPNSIDKGLAGYTVKRLAGNDRYETNLLILEETEVTSEAILVATGTGFADSLSASATGLPMLLVNKELNPKQKAFLEAHKGNAKYIIGGTSAVSAKVEQQVKVYGTVKRLAGNGRYDTSVLVAKEFFSKPTSAVVAYGRNFPDGLSGGPLAYAIGGPLLLAENNAVKIIDAYTEKVGITSGYVLGGSGLVSDASVKTIFNTNTIK